MRFATYNLGGANVAGVVDGDRVHPLPPGTRVLDLVRAGLAAALDAGHSALSAPPVPLGQVRLRPPLEPVTVRDFVTFEEHMHGARRSVDGTAEVVPEWYDAPTFYFTNPHTIVGPDDEIPVPGGSQRLDFELEVAAVVGKEGADLDLDTAAGHIFGYTIFNDWSARDLQQHEMRIGLGPAKGKDFASTLGPWIVTADEVDGYADGDGFLDLWCTASVNRVEIGRDLLSNMGWTFATMVAYASRDSRVVAGDILASGTCGNGGCLAELWGRCGDTVPPPLQPGDTITITVEAIGTIANTVVAGRSAPPLPGARRRDPAAARRRVTGSRQAPL